MKTPTLKPARMGSISHGTLRTKDLLETFANELESLIFLNGDYFSQPENFNERDRLNNLVGEAMDSWTEDGSELENEENAEMLVNEDLMDALQVFAPPYCYFGAHVGDGSDFGFWPCMEQIEELPTVENSDGAKELGGDCKSVNDHGNVTIYGADGSILLEFV